MGAYNLYNHTFWWLLLNVREQYGDHETGGKLSAFLFFVSRTLVFLYFSSYIIQFFFQVNYFLDMNLCCIIMCIYFFSLLYLWLCCVCSSASKIKLDSHCINLTWISKNFLLIKLLHTMQLVLFKKLLVWFVSVIVWMFSRLWSLISGSKRLMGRSSKSKKRLLCFAPWYAEKYFNLAWGLLKTMQFHFHNKSILLFWV